MKIIAFAGSNSKNSINKKLVSFVSEHFQGEQVEVLDLNDYPLPIYGVDAEQEQGIPAKAKEFAQKWDESGLIILSLAEHNGSYSAVFKNIFDWISRIPNRPKDITKPMFLMATSPGGRGGLSVLEAALQRFPYHQIAVLEHYSLPFFDKNFREGEGVIDEEKKKELLEKIDIVKRKLGSE